MKKIICLLMVLLIPAVAFSDIGVINGTVYSRETDEPLAGAEVQIIEIEKKHAMVP